MGRQRFFLRVRTAVARARPRWVNEVVEVRHEALPSGKIFQGVFDGFLVKILPDGSGPAYGTYVEGDPSAAQSVLQGVGLDASGNLYVAGFFLVDPSNPIVD